MDIVLMQIHSVAMLAVLVGCQYRPGGMQGPPPIEKGVPGDYVFQVSVEGVERSYIVHVPTGYSDDRRWPVVLMLHGGGGSARNAMWETGWAEKADQEGFLAAFPEGTPPDPSRPSRFRDNLQTWNDGSERANVGAVARNAADVEFISALLDDLQGRYQVDERRIYATGFSNGASMTFRLARELSQRLAAAAPVAGSDWLMDEKPERAIPILYLTGTADPLNPMGGGEIRLGGVELGDKPPVQRFIDDWVRLHRYPETPAVVYDQDDAKGVAYGFPGEAPGVVLYTIQGHGHHWPGGRSALPVFLAGKNTARLNATELIWEFFTSQTE